MLCYAKNRDGCNFARCKIHQSRRFGGKTLVLDEKFFNAEAKMGPMRVTRLSRVRLLCVNSQYPSSKDRGELMNTVTIRCLSEASSAV